MRVIFYSARGKYFILLASSFMFPISVSAQCVDTQDCQTLGYTETSNSGNCVKCPFGEYWSCPETEDKNEVQCSSSYRYTCSGEYEEKPFTGSCNGKYQKCDCVSGYMWSNNSRCSPTGKVSYYVTSIRGCERIGNSSGYSLTGVLFGKKCSLCSDKIKEESGGSGVQIYQYIYGTQEENKAECEAAAASFSPFWLERTSSCNFDDDCE